VHDPIDPEIGSDPTRPDEDREKSVKGRRPWVKRSEPWWRAAVIAAASTVLGNVASDIAHMITECARPFVLGWLGF
jgi:hypothetical protein